MTAASEKKGVIHLLQEFSIPLILGVVAALVYANLNYETYEHLIHLQVSNWVLFGHDVTLHFLINDIFMVFFFGIAAKEITEAVLPGGDLNPPKKAINPLMGTLGGVVGPVGVYFLLTMYMSPDKVWYDAVANGWGIPTATDIALAWLIARIIFGNTHPAVNFLLLLAVADDAIGLGIIAVFYPDPAHMPEPIYLLYLTVPGMLVAWLLRKKKVQAWLPYILFGGTLSWLGFILAHLHPALALVPIVPFLPGPTRDTGLFVKADEADQEHAAEEAGQPVAVHHEHSPLHNFEHNLKLPVDLGLFFFGFANAGVAFSSISNVTWIVLISLLVGKTVGIFLFSWVAKLFGAPLPDRMDLRHLTVAGIVAGLGLTVALFVAGEAFQESHNIMHQGPAKMGAVFSAIAAFVAIVVARGIGIKRED